MTSYQAPLSLGFSRQEHWSALPFPSPMYESESEVAQSCPTLSDPIDGSLPGSSAHGIFPGKSTGVGCHCLLQGLARMSQSFNKFLWLEEIFQKKHLFVCMCFCFFFVHFFCIVLLCILWIRQWHPTQVLLPGKSHGWRSLEGCSPRGR